MAHMIMMARAALAIRLAIYPSGTAGDGPMRPAAAAAAAADSDAGPGQPGGLSGCRGGDGIQVTHCAKPPSPRAH